VSVSQTTSTAVLQVEDLRTYFFGSTVSKAVDGVSLTLSAGETLGIVGESGSGKSTLALSIMGLVPRPGRIVSGKILLEGEDLLEKTPQEWRRVRGRTICMILQDPLSSLNPALTIGDQVTESFRHRRGERGLKSESLRARAIELLGRVGVGSPEARLRAYPHQLSGGMRQRVAGAIAMSAPPRVLIADEPTTALDTTTQYQYLTMLKELQVASGMSLIFVTHDFGVVARMCDKVAVMYAGKVVESASVRDLFDHPTHPYTDALIKSLPNVDEDVDRLPFIDGQPPPLDQLPVGCSFAPRCPYAFERCLKEFPPALGVSPGHDAACWLVE
jgi:oligopeptide/dipeptide ABC transporter ATP-binding protein